MKGFAAILILGLAGFAAFGQSSRPRVATTPAPPIVTDDPSPNVPTEGPPVLRRNGSPPQSQAGPPPASTSVKGDGSDEIVKVETNLVTMPVSVLDREGRFISGLQQRDFQIFENGVQQKLEYFASVETPFTVVVMIDVSPSTQWQIEDIQRAAETFVDQLRPVDKVVVMDFDEKVRVLTRPTNNRAEIRRAIELTRMGDGTSLYEAVAIALNQQLNQIQGRKAVVLFTDGVDTTSRRATFQSTVADAEESDGLIYTIRYDTSRDMGNSPWGGGGSSGSSSGGWVGIVLGGRYPGGGGWGRGGNRGSSRAEYETGKKYLIALAEKSGGREFEADSLQNLDVAFSGIAEELRRQYSLGYYPETVGKTGERRQIRIRVMRPDVVVRAKNTYVFGQTNRTLAGK